VSSYLSKEELIGKLGVCRGLIPVEIDVNKRDLIWRDLGGFHNYEGFFRTSLKTFAQLRSLGPAANQDDLHTDIDVLESTEILTENIYPSAFIFHAGRTGSTLLSKSLARSRSNLVFGEADIHNLIWGIFSNNWQSAPVFGEREKRQYKNLILAMGRRRLDFYKNHIIKFTSTNILQFNLIKSVFPDVPALFIYREPSAILRSFIRNAPAWASAKTGPLKTFEGAFDPVQSQLEFYQRTISLFFSAAMDTASPGLRFLNYDQLIASNLPVILGALKISAEGNAIKQMQDQFEYDSKSEYKLRPHERREVITKITVSDKLNSLYKQLFDSEQNILR
jgi:hypothetical protein